MREEGRVAAFLLVLPFGCFQVGQLIPHRTGKASIGILPFLPVVAQQ